MFMKALMLTSGCWLRLRGRAFFGAALGTPPCAVPVTSADASPP